MAFKRKIKIKLFQNLIKEEKFNMFKAADSTEITDSQPISIIFNKI